MDTAEKPTGKATMNVSKIFKTKMPMKKLIGFLMLVSWLFLYMPVTAHPNATGPPGIEEIEVFENSEVAENVLCFIEFQPVEGGAGVFGPGDGEAFSYDACNRKEDYTDIYLCFKFRDDELLKDVNLNSYADARGTPNMTEKTKIAILHWMFKARCTFN